MRWKWFLASLPAVVGVIAKVLSMSGLLADPAPILYIRGDIGTLSLLAGMIVSILASAFLVLYARADTRYRQGLDQMQAQVAEERRRFLRRLDHELKNPLTAIRAGLANLDVVSAEGAQREVLDGLETQALRLSRLAADLRKLAELETRPLERTSVDMTQLLQDVIDVAQDRPEARYRTLNLTVPQAPWPLPAVEGDPDLLFLAVYNLLSNALKFTQSGDTIEIRGFEDGKMVVVEVADTGPGIAEEDVPHVWEELYRGKGARGIPGSGLGLALVQAIAQRHSGQVGLRSREGQGTVFTIQLPIK